MAGSDQFRELPSVDRVLCSLTHWEGRYPRRVVLQEVRSVLDSIRDEMRAGRHDSSISVQSRVEQNLSKLEAPSLRRVINATGVVLHTNLGRAPLASFDPLLGYCNLEYDLVKGARGKRDVHLQNWIERLTGAPGIAVNNNAAAIYLALNELAAGFEVVVSRGELIEIGDGFRIPEIMRKLGAVLREVGTTNRTRVEDYRDAINERTRLLLRVHPSNFRMEGFTARPELSELVTLGKERGIAVYEDLGSGCVVDLRMFGIHEPLVSDSIRAGANLVSFSGDKLLGGPQAGILAGDRELVARLRRNPMFRALRLDKLIYQSLETTFRHLVLEQWDRIPTLHMISQSPGDLRARAERLAAQIQGVHAKVVEGSSLVGGGSTPEQPLDAFVLAVSCPDVVFSERQCRQHNPPVIARIEDNKLLFDLRTVLPEEEEDLAHAIRECCS